jgi:hypothetical protein
MKNQIILLALLLLIPCLLLGQLHFEVVTSTTLNMTLKDSYSTTDNAPIVSTPTHFAGGGFNFGLALRYNFLKRFAISGGVEYQYKGHEANFLQEPKKPTNSKHTFHLLVVPFDLSYTFKNGLGLHVGAELVKLLYPSSRSISLEYQDKSIVAALMGISYTYKRIRFELLYKHHLAHYMRFSIPYTTGWLTQTSGVLSHYNRFHDIQLRIAVRFFSTK